MTLSHIFLFLLFGVLYRLLARGRGKGWVLFTAGALAVYWLQPATPVRTLDFWFPTLTLGLAVLGWALTAPEGSRQWKANLPAAGVLAGVVLLVGLSRYLDLDSLFLPGRPPVIEIVLAGLAVLALLSWLALRVKWPHPALWVVIGGIGLLLVVLKSPPLAQAASVALRTLMDQSTTLAAAGDLRWLGFSYVAFRLVHTLRERQNGRLPAVTLQEYLIYVIFPPSLTAGPIDRLDRFIKDLRGIPAAAGKTAAAARPLRNTPAATPAADPNPPAASSPLSNPNPPLPATSSPLSTPGSRLSVFFGDPVPWAAAAQRLALGLLKKFVVADSLALVALNASNAAQVQGAGWAWALVIAYSFQIYFDFSGYTDIAIGLGRLLGITLPENFNAPYLKPNLTQFWSNWHMTLTNWFRAYYFNPVTRWMRTLRLTPAAGDEEGKGLSPAFIIFFTQLTTMILIGLWHGVTWNFVLWGVWHGLGQFVQNRFSEAMRPRYTALDAHSRLHAAVTALTTLVTFVYVSLGWVWFALPDVGLALGVFGKLFGM